jgi:hypothetical protein
MINNDIDKNIFGYLYVHEYPIQEPYIYILKNIIKKKYNNKYDYNVQYIKSKILEIIEHKYFGENINNNIYSKLNNIIKIYDSDFIRYINNELMFTYTIVDDISLNEISPRKNNICSNILIKDSIYSTKNQSCDIFTFKYIKYDKKSLNNFKIEEKHIEKIKINIMRILNIQDNNNLFIEWCAQILSLPELNTDYYYIGNKSNNNNIIQNKNIKTKINIFNKKKFIKIIKKSKEYYKKILSKDKIILDNISNNKKLYNNVKMCTYIQKIYLKKEDIICFFGDFHGTIHTFMRSLMRLYKYGYMNENMELNKNFYIIFLGDFIDRGIYSSELVYLILLLKQINNNNVQIIIGNHENKYISSKYGFMDEINNKFTKDDENLFNKISNLWYYMPIAIFINIDGQHIQCSHGGFHRNLKRIKNILDSDKQFFFIDKNCDDLLWSDFECGNLDLQFENINGDIGKINKIRNIGSKYNAITSVEYLLLTGLSGLIRGHQDTYDNTKIISYKYNCNDPINWKDIYENEYSIFSNLEPKENDKYSIKFPIPFKHRKSIAIISFIYFPPIYTLSTSTGSRIIASDGFSIYTSNNN